MEIKKFTDIKINDVKISLLKEIFPEVFSENMIDFNQLKSILSDNLVNEKNEIYKFSWANKSKAEAILRTPSNGTLRAQKICSKNWENTHNIYIEGENLETLKILKKSYYNKIKAIYIDPPYNTGKDFIYPDNFKENLHSYLQLTEQLNDDNIKMTTNLETNGRFHSDWLNMMYSRLKLSRDLLIDDGVIFISIDDNEVFNLKKLCDLVFGEENFIEMFSWKKSSTPPNLSKKSKKSLEYILCYQKKINSIKFKGIQKESSSNNGLLNQTNKFGKLIFPSNKVQTNLTDQKIKKGNYGTENYEIILHNDIECKNGVFITPVELSSKFKWTQEKLDQELLNGTIISIKTKTLSPSYEKLEYDPEVPSNLIDLTVGVDTTEAAGKYLTNLFGLKVFDYPKPISLVKYLINFICEKDDIILDFFGGSSTTAEAVMRLNAEDNGKRKYILIQIPETIDKSSEIFKAGYKNICEIGKERIRRAGERIKADETLPLENRKKLDTGFKVFKLDTSNIKEWDSETENLKQSLFDSIDNIKEDRTTLDVLYEILLKYGLDLNVPIVETNNFYSIGGGTLLVNLNKTITLDAINSICEEYKILLEADDEFKTTVVLRDSSFSNDVDKTNAIQKLKQVGIKEIRSI